VDLGSLAAPFAGERADHGPGSRNPCKFPSRLWPGRSITPESACGWRPIGGKGSFALSCRGRTQETKT